MVAWLNRAVYQLPRNGTTTHTLDPSSATNLVSGAAFTPTAGRLLVAVIEGAVTSTTPSGWTLPSGGSAINNSGLYVWYRTAAGSDTFTTTHNASNYPVVVAIYEFAAGSTFVASTAATGLTGGTANPNLTGLTGTNLVVGVKAGARGSAHTYTSTAWSATTTPTNDVDLTVAYSTTDGYVFTLGYVEGYTGSSFQPTGLATGTMPTYEALTFAVNVAAGGSGSYTASGTVATTSTVAGTVTSRLSASGASVSSSTATGDVRAALPVTGTASSASTAAGAVGGSLAVVGAVTSSTAAMGRLAESLAGAAASSTSITGQVAAVRPVAGAVTSSSIITGDIAARLPVAGTATSSTTAAGTLDTAGGLAGAVTATSTVTGTITARRTALGQAASLTTTAGQLTARRPASGTVDTASNVLGNLSDGRVTPRPDMRRLTVTAPARALAVPSTTRTRRVETSSRILKAT